MNSVRLASANARNSAAGSHFSFYLLTAAAFVSTWTGLRVGPLMPVDSVLAIAFVLGIPAIIRQRGWLPRWIVIPAFVVAMILVIHVILPTSSVYLMTRFELQGLSSITGDVSESPLSSTVQWLVALLLLPLLIRSVCVEAGRSPTRIAGAWALGAAVSAAVGVVDYIGVTNIGESLVGYANTSGRESGLASHANNLGFSCALAAPIAVYMLTRGRTLVGSTMAGLLAFGALVSGSRGSQVGLLLAVVLCLAAVPAGRRILPVVAWLGALSAALVVAFVPTIFAGFSDVLRFGQAGGAGDSDSGRRMIAGQAVEDFQHRPFWGIGYEVLTQSHSIYLQLLAAGGLLLFMAMAYFFVGVLRASRQTVRDGEMLGGFLGCSVLIWLAVGVIENQLTDRYLYIPVAILLVLASTPRDQHHAPPPQRRMEAVRTR